jgi:dihydrosphingosine 1-phosphate phosphatase
VLPLTCASAAALSWVYPDPVDSTPSYDDTVSFVWVMAGVASGTRAFVGHPLSVAVPALANVRYSFATVGLPITLARLAVGVAIVVVWRLSMKRILLTVLPPLYRALGLKPRKFFLSAQYVVAAHTRTHPL